MEMDTLNILILITVAGFLVGFVLIGFWTILFFVLALAGMVSVPMLLLTGHPILAILAILLAWVLLGFACLSAESDAKECAESDAREF